MRISDKLICGLIIAGAVVIFAVLVNYLGGLGAILSACMLAGLATIEREETI